MVLEVAGSIPVAHPEEGNARRHKSNDTGVFHTKIFIDRKIYIYNLLNRLHVFIAVNMDWDFAHCRL